MFNLKIWLIVLFAATLSNESVSQITDITRLPVQNSTQSIKESAPVWLSENEIMIFYLNQSQDTIFSAVSYDRGTTWQQPSFVIKIDTLIEEQDKIYLSAISTETGRILLAWSVFSIGINLIYSDDSGTTWSDVQIILGPGSLPVFQKKVSNVKLSKAEGNRLILNLNGGANAQAVLYYRVSDDNGTSWGDTIYSINRNGFYNFNEQTIISNQPNSLMCVFKLKRLISTPDYDIYAIFSSDNGLTWSDTVKIAGNELQEKSPRVTVDKNGTIWLAYLREDTIKFSDSPYNKFIVNNIFYKISTDGGASWSDEQQFTYYLGDDNNLSITANANDPLVTYSTPKFTGHNQIAIGYLNETIENYTPPALFQSRVINGVNSPVVLAYAKDDNAVKDIEFILPDSAEVITLYDDGLHEDLEPDDDIYGNRILTSPLSFSNDRIIVNANKLKVPFNNKGIVADVRIIDTINAAFNLLDIDNNFLSTRNKVIFDYPSLGSYEEGIFLFSSGFFLSGYSNGELWANAVSSSSLVEDYQAGIVGSNPEDSKFFFYAVTNDDIPFGPVWQRWKDAVEIGAEFYDGDGDGIYNPVDKNFNGTWDANEDMPPLLGDVTAWCVYNDGIPDSLRRWQSAPQGIEIRQTVFASSLPELENVLFIKYSILNTGTVTDVMDSVFFGIWEDADVGDHTDDVVGCDTSLNSGFFYNNTPDWVYGENCPSFFTTLLQGPIVQTQEIKDTAVVNYGTHIGTSRIGGAKNLDISSHVFHIGGDPFLHDPRDRYEARNYLEGKTSIGEFPDPCTFIYCEVRGGVNCSDVNPVYWASGDPVEDVGWINLMNVDFRNLLSTGPFKLEKNKPQEIIIAYVMGRGEDYFNSITVARENVQRAIAEYENNFSSLTYSPQPATNPVIDYVLYQNYPNPFNPSTTIRYELPQDGLVTIKVYDILGQEVRTIVNEFKKADRYEVEFNAIGLASGVYIYRMKVNNFIESKKMILIR